MPLNVAEGAGQPTGKSSARYFGIARGSAMEYGAILDAFAAIGAGDKKDIEDGLALIVRIVGMLTKMCR
ncbi:MAG: four helix bundle protein [Myxococcota bacterium]